ncbi:unnamed protein product [Mucor hiemalis]
MSELQWNRDSLPLVVLIIILQSATKSDLLNYAVVCKAWLKPVQSILYGDVNIETLLQLETFDDTLTRKPHLGELVKVFSLLISSLDKITIKVTKRVSNLLYNGLPNLQEFPKSSLDTYSPVLRALKNSRLKMLKVLYSPIEDERKNYANCILLMSNRVEQVEISNEYCNSTDLNCDSLYSKLKQYSNLKEMDICDNSNTPWFQTLEHITVNCKKLTKLKFQFERQILPEAGFDMFAPSKNIEWLEGNIDDCKMLTYIMHKFPQPRKLRLGFWYSNLDFGDYTRLLTYLSKMDVINVGRFTVNRRVLDITTRYWKKTVAELGSKSVKVCYFDQAEVDCALEIIKREDATEPTYLFVYHIVYYDSQHAEVIKTMGRYIGQFHLVYDMENEVYDFPEKDNLPKKLLNQLSTLCPNLHTLHFEGWFFRGCSLSSRNLSLDELYFKNCTIVGPFFIQLSARMPHLKRLYIDDVLCGSENTRTSLGYDVNDIIEIEMPRTRIDTIAIFCQEELRYVKLFVASDKAYHYYRYEHNFLPSNEKEYSESKEYSRICFSCLNKPEFRFK